MAAAAVVICAGGAPAQAEVTPQEAREWRADVSAAREFAAGRAGDVSFAVIDMQRRRDSVGGSSTVPMASTFKVMLMVAYLRQGHVRNRGLAEWESDLIRPMIRRSDNASATRIRDMLGREKIERLARLAEMRDFQWNEIWGYCRTSARDQAFFLRTLRRYVPERHWPFAKRQLKRIIPPQRWGIGQVDVHGWALHFKGGWGSGSGLVDHQVALLRKDGFRIGVAVLTEGNPDHPYGKATLKGVFSRLLRGLPR